MRHKLFNTLLLLLLLHTAARVLALCWLCAGAFPKDFRGYLAKGVLLRERGRQGDAERMFLQVSSD